MRIESLRERVRSEPFMPFTINLADGRRFRIDHPEFIAVAPKGPRVAVVFDPQGRGYEIIDVSLVTSLSVATENGSNGKNDPDIYE